VLRNAFDVLCCVPPHFESIEEGGGDDQVWCSWRPGEGKETKRKRGKDKTSGSPRWADPLSRRKAFSDCWLAFLRIELPLDLYKARGWPCSVPSCLTPAQKVLVRLHAAVIPHLVNPLLLSDFLTRAIDLGSLLGALALNGLFVLMTCHGLEYPQFYTRLYALLEPGVFLARSRKQFFELLDVFLRSTHLPAYLAAAFAKRLARLTLAAPPHGAMLAIGFVHNLLRRHPGCCVLIHREQQGAAARSDPFLSEESDPAKCCALESSLWELQALRQHYSPAVSRFVAVLERELGNRRKTQELDLALLCSSSYSTLFEEENGRRMKTVPLAFYEPQAEPTALFDFQEDELKAFAA
jgi:U3 small nucleolar RNA-associated protein 19